MAWTWSNVAFSATTFINGVVSDSTGQYIVVAASTRGFYYSTNYGASWSQTTTPALQSNNAIALGSNVSGTTMYAVVDNSGILTIYCSTNYGMSWVVCNQQISSLTNVNSITCDSTGGNVVLITSFQGGSSPVTSKVYYSANPNNPSGNAWQQSTLTGASAIMAIDNVVCRPNGSVYILSSADINGYTGGIWTSTDYGASWTLNSNLGSGISNTQSWASVTCSSDGSTFLAASAGHYNGGVSSDYNGGVIQCTGSADPAGANWTVVSAFTGSCCGGLIVCNNNASKIFVPGPAYIMLSPAPPSGVGGLLYSYDGTTLYNDSYITSNNISSFALLLNKSGVNIDKPLFINVLGTSGAPAYGFITTRGSNGLCFKEGSKILCMIDGVDVYIPVETMTPGILVKTLLDGYKKVSMIGSSKLYNPGHSMKAMKRLYVCKNMNYPQLTEDLVITGDHAILVSYITDKQRAELNESMGRIYVTDRKYRLIACVDERAVPYTEEGLHTIWHFALENENYYGNYGVYANGLLVETCSLRMMKELSGMELV